MRLVVKSFRLLSVFLVFILIAEGCVQKKVVKVSTTGNGTLPPGQQKKVTGEKSAKKYAPGQQKKKGK